MLIITYKGLGQRYIKDCLPSHISSLPPTKLLGEGLSLFPLCNRGLFDEDPGGGSPALEYLPMEHLHGSDSVFLGELKELSFDRWSFNVPDIMLV